MAVKKILSTMFSDVFLASLFLYLAVAYIDLSQPGIISRALNLSTLLMVCVVAGALSILIGNPDEEKQKKSSVVFWVYTVTVSIAVGALIWQALLPFSHFALIFGAGGASIVFFACFAMMSSDKHPE